MSTPEPKNAAEQQQARWFVENIALCCRTYGWTWHYCMSLPYGIFAAMADQAHRILAREKRDLVDVFHTGDPKWLQERLSAIAQHGIGGKQIDDEQAAAGWAELRAMMVGATERRQP